MIYAEYIDYSTLKQLSYRVTSFLADFSQEKSFFIPITRIPTFGEYAQGWWELEGARDWRGTP
jgi:hypothetical protein